MSAVFQSLLMIISTTGYMRAAHKLTKTKFNFVPIFTISFMTLFVYFGGILGFLLESSILLISGGCFCFLGFIAELIRNKKNLITFSLFNVCFFAVSIPFFCAVLSTGFQHYDNFSHWGIVVKQMLMSDSFPTSADKLIDFTNYPLGTSSWIYYICRFTSNSQNFMMFAQALLIFACMYALFGIIKEKKRFLLYIFLAAGCSVLSVLNITIRINNLLVDFVLPVMTLAAWSVIYSYQSAPKRCTLVLSPILGLLFIIKHTGIIYVIFALLFWSYQIFCKKERRNKENLMCLCLTVASSALSTFAWQYRMSAVFAGSRNKFDITVNNVQGVLVEKTTDDIRQIIKNFFGSVFDSTTRPTFVFLVLNIVAISVCIALHYYKIKWKLPKALAALNVMTVVYYIGILGLYIFSMPLDEAIVLSGFERYASSIIVLFGGGLVLCATIDIESTFYVKIGANGDTYKAFKSPRTKRSYQKGVIASMFVAFLLLESEYNGLMYNNKQYPDSLPKKIEDVCTDRWYESGTEDTAKYLVYGTDSNGQMTSYYYKYVARYYLYAPNIDTICAFYEDNLINLLSNYDYLVIVETDSFEKMLLKKYFNIDGEAGIYNVKELFFNNPKYASPKNYYISFDYMLWHTHRQNTLFINEKSLLYGTSFTDGCTLQKKLLCKKMLCSLH